MPLSEVLSGCPHCCLNLVSLASLPEVLNGAHFHSIQHLLLWVGGVGARVMGASMVGGIGSQAPLYLLPSYLCLHELQWLGSQSPLCYIPCCYWLLWGLGLSSYSLWAGNASTASIVCPLLPPLWSSQPILRGTDVWNSLASWCVG